jgi:hypothetical protein
MEAHSTRTSIITTTKSVLQEKMIFWQQICCWMPYKYTVLCSVFLSLAVVLSIFFYDVHTHGCFVYFIINLSESDLLKKGFYTCTVPWPIKSRKSLALSFFLVDQSIGITVYSYSIWQHGKNYHKNRHNPICFSCYVVTIPVQREMFNDNRWVN